MTSERWHQIEALFEAALAQPPEARAAFLDAACTDAGGRPDPDLRCEVASLLDAHAGPGPVDRLAEELVAPLARAAEGEPAEGRRVGPYRVLRTLGRGGMGAVYLAERADGQFEQRVALKLIRDGVDTDAQRARFLHERQTLARLQHPGIARLLDGGLAADGRPYFAMEVVDGERLDRYCDARRLDLRQRLRLFIEVCEAVHHAHQRLVVHRDLKPSNVLVTEDAGGRPRVKLLDFGIARLLEDADGAGGEAPTRPATRVMTPEYAAPEQLRGEPVSTASDVYSLGVVLYELLTGHRPYDTAALSPGELERVVCETAPPRPSVVVTRSVDGGGDGAAVTPEAVSRARGTEPDTLARRLAGDLDTIVMKALEKEPERRYASAEAFLEDVRRHLAGLPVQARPATAGYRTRMFVRRHRVGVAAAALVGLALVAGLAGTAWQARRAAAERDRAQAEQAKTAEALDFLVDLFEQADPGATGGEVVTAREVLDRAAGRLATLDEQPDVKATLLDALGRVYQNLGLYDRAAAHLEEALALRRTLHPTPHPDLAASLHHLGYLQHARSHLDAADDLYREAVAAYRALPKPNEVALADVLHHHATLLSTQGDAEAAEPLIREALERRRAALGAAHPDVGAALYALAAIRHSRGDYAGAEALFREAVALFQAIPNTLHPAAADARIALAQFLQFRGELGEAEALYREALALQRRLYGDDHPGVASTRFMLGAVRYERGAFDEAEALLRDALARGIPTLGADHYDMLGARQTLASVLYAREDFDAAADTMRGVVADYRRLFGGDHGTVVTSLLIQGRAALGAGRHAAAEADFEEALAMSRRLFGDAHPYEAQCRRALAAVAEARGDVARAETLYREALALYARTLRPDHHFVAEAKLDLGTLLLERGQAAQAEPLLRDAITIARARYEPTHERVANAQSALGAALAALGRYDEAAPLLVESHAVLHDRLGPDHRFTRAARRRLDAFRQARDTGPGL